MKKYKKLFLKILLSIIFLIILSVIGFFLLVSRVDSFSKNYKYDIKLNKKFDAILVLGTKVYQDGSPSSMLKDRLDKSIQLYKYGASQKIIVSGDHGTKRYDEVNAMKLYLIKNGVKSNDIFMDHAGFDTYDSVYRAKEIFKAKSIVICTQEFHFYRAVYIARKIGLDAYGFTCENQKMSRNAIRENLAKVKAYFETEIIKRKSKYLGEPIPVFGNGNITNDK